MVRATTNKAYLRKVKVIDIKVGVMIVFCYGNTANHSDYSESGNPSSASLNSKYWPKTSLGGELTDLDTRGHISIYI